MNCALIFAFSALTFPLFHALTLSLFYSFTSDLHPKIPCHPRPRRCVQYIVPTQSIY
jgi:hypothetical protein